jgi:RNA polymerase sigma factor (sigma-70 family)
MLSELPRDHPSSIVLGPALDELMARHDGLVHAVLRRQWGGSLSYDERLQAGRIGLWHALLGYDPARATAFSTYAWPAIARQIWREVANSPASSRREGQGPASVEAAHLSDPAEALLADEQRAALARLLQSLPDRFREVIVAYYGLAERSPRSLRALGRELGLSHETVRLRLWAALVWLRHPSHSLGLRQLLDRNTVADYETADDLAQAWLRRRGGRPWRR